MTAYGKRVLIVEDDLTIAENLYDYLERQEMIVDVAYDGHGALAMLEADGFHAMVLDLGLPGLSGLDVLRALTQGSRRRLRLPVLVLTARDRVEDKLMAFDLGAEDYLVKPFALAEAAARLRVLLTRRVQPDTVVLRYGDLSLNTASYEVLVANQSVVLPRKAVLILDVLLRRAASGGIVSHAELIGLLWPEEPPSSRALHDQLHILRKRLRDADGPDIEVVRGAGWRLAG